MEPSRHDFYVVHSIINCFALAGFQMWLAGGWAEELQGLFSPRQHGDIDLLYPATDFSQLDTWLASIADLSPVYAKRFSHKRAIVYEQVLVEIVLLEPLSRSHITRFFDHRYEFTWPDDTLSYISWADEIVPVASSQTLYQYRQNNYQIEASYLAYLEAQISCRGMST